MHQLAKPRRHYLAEEVARILCQEIRQCRWQGWLPSERRLLQLLSVSRLTLRQALQKLAETGIIEVVPRRGYRILETSTAAPANPAHSREIGLLCPAPLQSLPPFIGQVMDGLRTLCAESDMHLEVIENRRFNAMEPSQFFPELLRTNPKGCWVLFMAHRRVQEWFARSDAPVVIYGNVYAHLDLPAVGFDYHAVIWHATSMLLGKGHRSIAFLGYKTGAAGEEQSIGGFREAIKSAGAGVHSHELWAEGDDTGRICRMVDGALRMKHPPTAFIIGRTHHYLTVATHLLRCGFHIPRDISLVSRMEDPFLSFVQPAPATYRANPANLSQKLYRTVAAVTAKDPTPARQTMILPEYLPGGSVASLKEPLSAAV